MSTLHCVQLKAFVNARLSGKVGSGSSSGSSGGGSKGTASVELTGDNFEELVLGSQELWMVEFFAPW